MSEILDIKTKQERPQIRIDEVLYDLMLPTDLELKDMLWLQRAGKKIEELQKQLEKDVVSERVANEFQSTLSRMSAIILGDVPKEVRELLTDVQKMQVVNTYAELIKQIQEKKGFFEEGEEESGPGSTSSPNSKGSTGETSRVG
jgi:hypothetical protein